VKQKYVKDGSEITSKTEVYFR